uniref:Uncharacterized protein n=1 Tax=Setaria italica TaxID=4555 RepID=K3ZDC9_SETIT
MEAEAWGGVSTSELAADGTNYLTWAMDVKIVLTAKADKFRTLHFLRHHLHPDNYAVHKICSKLCFCNQPLDDAEMIEKTLSTFLSANRILQQQYRRHNYTKYSDLIYDLFQIEKYDELLTKNHQLRPMGATPLSEVHFNAHNNNKKFGGKKFKKNFKGKMEETELPERQKF